MFEAISNYINEVVHGREVAVGGKRARWTKVRDLKVGAKIAVVKDSGPARNDAVEFEEIVEIRAVGREQVWDIEVEGSRNFVGNGILAHNTYLAGTSGITTVATVSGTTAFASMVVDQSGVGDIFTASVSGLPKVTILNSGDLNVANLTTNGAVYSNAGTLTNVNPSSWEYKSNINDLSLNTEKFLSLKVKSFNWNNNGQADYGLIAEDIKNLVPELYMEQNGVKGYRQGHMVFYLLQIAQDQEAKLAELPAIKTQIELIKEEMASVSARLAKAEPVIASDSEAISSLILQIASLSATPRNDINVATLSAEFGNFTESLKVVGKTQLAETTIGGNLTIGLLHFDDLKGEISSLNGQITVKGNLKVTGGIILQDTVTGEDYCVQITGGEIVKKKGECALEP